MSFDLLAEKRIRAAIEQGEFDRLPNAGTPIDLTEYFATPEHLRLAHSILKSAGCLPEEIELLNEIAALERRGDLSPEDLRRLEGIRLRLALLLERARKPHR